MTLTIESPQVYTQHGVAVSVTGIAQVKIHSQNRDMLATACQLFLGKPDVEIRKIAQETLEGHQRAIMGNMSVKIQGSNRDMLEAACQHFLGKSEREVASISQETLEGHQRAIMGNMTVEEIYKDRKKFSKSVFDEASSDLIQMGIMVVSYTIKDIRDDEGYIESLGKKRTAEVKRDALIGEAISRRDAAIKGYLKALGQARTAQVKRDAKIGEAEALRDATIKVTY
ncbi:DgyrCDS5825 [Dimorphilus gyrociliatus]|uniref:DgyrCDS5825 n=1 Tax=Dimorphilus gyrociliatus TaxID=2664684 RepID=A0A7I8VL31_9ANNE|nr:DgyrCDS5825 [Dimorphilus gyrociliatus]